MDNRPPLQLHLLAHPQSQEANRLATALMHRFVEPPASGGLRIPVFFTPDRGDDLPPQLNATEGLNLDAAKHTIVVILADERMMRTIPTGTGAVWRAFAQTAIDQAPLDSSPHHVLPVALDAGGYQICGAHHVIGASLAADLPAEEVEERRIAEVSFHIAVRAIQLLERGKVPATAPNRMQAPVSIFLSHAKADLDNKFHDDPVRLTRKVLSELPVEQWFDAQQIATSQKFSDAIRTGIRDCSIMLAFHTDHYGSRPWCRVEVLEAKKCGAHVVIVNALKSGEPRSFPYGGNVPVVRWQFAQSDVDARRVIDRAVLEALRYKHNRAILEGSAVAGEEVLAGPPEALTLAHQAPDFAAEKTFLYPDPPLGREELDVLHRLRPNAHFITPLTKLAAQKRSNKIETIAVSISDCDDLNRYGLSKDHFDTLSDEIHLYLLVAGLKIAYGGSLKIDRSKATNFTLRLFDLVRDYSKLAEGVNAKPLKNAILNVAPWPLWLSYGDSEWKLFAGDVAAYLEGPRPALQWSDDEVFPPRGESRIIASDTPQRRYAWARGLTAMRELITERTQARLVIGGKLEGFSGLVPGVVEEAWLSMMQKKPLYLAGGFGGAARAVCDLMQGQARQELSETWARNKVSDYDAALALYSQHGGNFCSIERMSTDIAKSASAGLETALNNGLDETENRELRYCAEPQRIAQLVLKGLGRV